MPCHLSLNLCLMPPYAVEEFISSSFKYVSCPSCRLFFLKTWYTCSKGDTCHVLCLLTCAVGLCPLNKPLKTSSLILFKACLLCQLHLFFKRPLLMHDVVFTGHCYSNRDTCHVLCLLTCAVGLCPLIKPLKTSSLILFQAYLLSQLHLFFKRSLKT